MAAHDIDSAWTESILAWIPPPPLAPAPPKLSMSCFSYPSLSRKEHLSPFPPISPTEIFSAPLRCDETDFNDLKVVTVTVTVIGTSRAQVGPENSESAWVSSQHRQLRKRCVFITYPVDSNRDPGKGVAIPGFIADEICDDHNSASGDGCSGTCDTIESVCVCTTTTECR